MLTSRETKFFHILDIINKSSTPVGANQLKRELEGFGVNISEATVGRLLAVLDQEALTLREGYRGRVLTRKGREKLKELRLKRERFEYGEEFFKIIDSKSEEELVELLIARRVIESQLARLAAINIKPDMEQEMRRAIELQAQYSKKGIAADYDVLFHKLIAKAAGNKVLDAMLDLIRKDSQLTPALEYIRKQVKSTIMVDHQKIVEAIINKDPDGAEQAMLTHIDNLIRDVNKYWHKKNKV